MNKSLVYLTLPHFQQDNQAINLYFIAAAAAKLLNEMTFSLFIAYPKALLTSISLPMEMIHAATSVARIKRRPNHQWHCHLVQGNHQPLEPIAFSKQLQLLPNHTLSDAPDAETIFLPPIWGNPERVIEQSAPLIDWLVNQHEQGKTICATGTGVCLLAHAGLLDHKIATTHWYYFDNFARKYPKVDLQRHHFITQSEQIYCCGSINALVDLTLYFIESQFGKEVTQVIEQHFSHEVNRTYDKPWYSSGSGRHPDEGIIEVQQWMQSHYGHNFELNSLARMANMSVRNFSRRFKLAVGKSALAYGLEVKMQVARELLKDSNLPLQDIADRLGFKDNAYFSRQFKLKHKMTPTAYREMVRGKLFDLGMVESTN